jgi:hypothetical protein
VNEEGLVRDATTTEEEPPGSELLKFIQLVACILDIVPETKGLSCIDNIIFRIVDHDVFS